MEQQTDSISKSVQNQNEGNVGNSEVTIPSPVINNNIHGEYFYIYFFTFKSLQTSQ